MSAKKLVIVESPAKAKTIAGYLGDGYVVESSIGHIRDLPNRASEVPKEEREKYGTMGVAIDNDFEPYYIVDADKKAKVSELKKLLKNADELLLATDEDREGEAIAWHLLDELKPTVPVHRMVFHEITPDAIAAAVANPRDINDDLVEAQEARRILDRLYGYEVSPVLWKKVMSGLSAGRVQSVATRLVVDRERERMAFRAASYWDLEATFDAGFPMSQIAIYIGWYDANVSGPFSRPTVEFMPGAFAYHLHSYSAHPFRSTSQGWVGPLLAKGATIGRYVVLGLLGRGGMGEVYAAYDPELDRKVAIKLLHLSLIGRVGARISGWRSRMAAVMK
jgi:hypothetical protein